MKLFLIPLILCPLLGGGVIAFLVVSGAPLGASSVFVATAAMVLGLTFYLLGRAAVALVREPLAEEVHLATGRRRKELEREKQLLLKAIKELEFDHQMRKISDRDFGEIAARYRGRAILVMRQLDETSSDFRTLVERDLLARKDAAKPVDEALAAPATPAAPLVIAPTAPAVKARAVASPTQEMAALTSEVAAAVAEIANISSGPWKCASCQTSNDEDALFCKRCGKPAVAAEAS
jgi:hypothetical protein